MRLCLMLVAVATLLAGCEECRPPHANVNVGVGTGGVHTGANVGRQCGPVHVGVGTGPYYQSRW